MWAASQATEADLIRAAMSPSTTGTSGAMPGMIRAVEYLGAERLVHGQVGNTLFTVRIDATLPAPRVGETLTLQGPAEHLHWFDAASGNLLAVDADYARGAQRLGLQARLGLGRCNKLSRGHLSRCWRYRRHIALRQHGQNAGRNGPG